MSVRVTRLARSLEDFMVSTLAFSADRTQGETHPDRVQTQERNFPVVRCEDVSSEAWASADLTGARHIVHISVQGVEDDVDRMAEMIERDLSTREPDDEECLLADLVRTNTDKIVDGVGGAACVMTFEALSLTE